MRVNSQRWHGRHIVGENPGPGARREVDGAEADSACGACHAFAREGRQDAFEVRWKPERDVS